MAWADARSGVASGIDQRGWAMENRVGASLRPWKKTRRANWSVSEGQAWRLLEEAHGHTQEGGGA